MQLNGRKAGWEALEFKIDRILRQGNETGFDPISSSSSLLHLMIVTTRSLQIRPEFSLERTSLGSPWR